MYRTRRNHGYGVVGKGRYSIIRRHGKQPGYSNLRADYSLQKKIFTCASLVYLVICNRILVTLHLIVKFPNVESKATKPSKSQVFNLAVI